MRAARRDESVVLRFDELTGPERAVWEAVATGSLVDLRVGQPECDDAATGGSWGADRQIRAQLLVELLTGTGRPSDNPPRALKVAGAWITGPLDLEAVTVLCPLLLDGCYFDHPISLLEARLPSLRLPGCHIPSLKADQLETRTTVELNKGFTATGEVRLLGAHIGGQLSLRAASLNNPDGFALTADSLTVEQGMFCDLGFTAQGQVRLLGARIGGGLFCVGARLTSTKGPALYADNLAVGHSMLCTEGFIANGEVRMDGAYIGGQLSFNGANLTNPSGLALRAARLRVDRDMLCRSAFLARGGVNLQGAHIKGALDFFGATLTSFEGPALNADGCSVDGGMYCLGDFTANGQVCLLGAHVGRELVFSGAKLTSSDGPALNADSLNVDQHMACEKGFTVQGEVRLLGAHIGGALSFDSASLTNPSGYALNARRLTVDRDMFCRGLTARGQVYLHSADIGGWLSFYGATLSNPGGDALGLRGMRARQLTLRPEAQPEGQVDLTYAWTEGHYDDESTWPESILLSGFVYDALHSYTWISSKARLDWLRRNGRGYEPQIYEQLASYYRRVGQDDDARKVLIAKHRRQRQSRSMVGWAWSVLLDWTVGYGYQTWKAGLWLLTLVGLGWWIFDQAHPSHLMPAKPVGQRPSFHAGLYALDVLLPFSDLGYQSAWITSGWARSFYLAWNLAGWVLITAVVAALSGLIKRD